MRVTEAAAPLADAGGQAADGAGRASGSEVAGERNPMPSQTLPLLLATLVVYVALGAATLLRVRRRRRAQLARPARSTG